MLSNQKQIDRLIRALSDTSKQLKNLTWKRFSEVQPAFPYPVLTYPQYQVASFGADSKWHFLQENLSTDPVTYWLPIPLIRETDDD